MGLFDRFKSLQDYATTFKRHIEKYEYGKAKGLLYSWQSEYPNDSNFKLATIISKAYETNGRGDVEYLKNLYSQSSLSQPINIALFGWFNENAINIISRLSLLELTDERKITICGFTFNVPQGFVEKMDERFFDDVDEEKGFKIILNCSVFVKNSEHLGISVIKYDNRLKINERNLGRANESKHAIKDVEGYLYETSGKYIFKYLQNGFVVMLVSSNRNLFESVIDSDTNISN